MCAQSLQRPWWGNQKRAVAFAVSAKEFCILQTKTSCSFIRADGPDSSNYDGVRGSPLVVLSLVVIFLVSLESAVSSTSWTWWWALSLLDSCWQSYIIYHLSIQTLL